MSLAGVTAGGGISWGPITLASIIPSGPISDNIWFADGFGTWFGTGNGTTQPDATWTWDDANQWMQLAIPGAAGTGLAEMRYRGDFSRAGAADTFYLNQFLPGVLTLTAGVTQTTAALFAFSNTQVANTPTVTNLATVGIELATGSGTVTNRAHIWLIGGGSNSGIRFDAATGENVNIYAGIQNAISTMWIIGDAGTSRGHIALQNDDVKVKGASGDALFLDSNVELAWGPQTVSSTAQITGIDWSTPQTNDGLVWGLATANPLLIFTDYANREADHAAAVPTNPTLAIYSVTSPVTAPTAFSELAYDKLTLGPGSGARGGVRSIIEEVTIAVGTGSAGVNTVGNLAPAGSLILGVAVRVTQAPGGGATTVTVGVTGGGNPDSLLAAIATALGTTGVSPGGNDGTQLPIANGAATTLVLTTDSDVTVSDMKVRVAVFYIDLTAPTS